MKKIQKIKNFKRVNDIFHNYRRQTFYFYVFIKNDVQLFMK